MQPHLHRYMSSLNNYLRCDARLQRSFAVYFVVPSQVVTSTRGNLLTWTGPPQFDLTRLVASRSRAVRFQNARGLGFRITRTNYSNIESIHCPRLHKLLCIFAFLSVFNLLFICFSLRVLNRRVLIQLLTFSVTTDLPHSDGRAAQENNRGGPRPTVRERREQTNAHPNALKHSEKKKTVVL